MSLDRRKLLWSGGILAAAIPARIWPAQAGDFVEIFMAGRKDGSKVWFDPVGVWIRPGQTVTWTNRDPGNAHTATAYHPANFDRPRRIPSAASPWDSDFLLPGESFSITLTRPGVYDYYCIPHEQAGMVGRIVVGEPPISGWTRNPTAGEGIPEVALETFPPVDDIIRNRIIRHI